MPKYKYTQEGYVIRDGDTKVPITDSTQYPNTNQDYLEFKAWVDGGGYVEPADPAPAPQRIIRDWEFRNRFTQEQLVGVMRAAMAGDNTAAMVWLALSTASDGVDLDKPEHVAGVQYLAATYPDLKINPDTILE